MNENNNQGIDQSTGNPKQQNEMSRRQFLNYTLGGTGAFMVGVPILLNLRFAVDPLLQTKTEGTMVKVVEESKITNEPQSFKFKVHVVDGWYEHDPEMEAWIRRGEDGVIYALSPICQHLGCTIDWNTHSDYPNQYYCPCHGAHYTIEGESLAVAPRPLNQYKIKIENGWVYLGDLHANDRVK